MKKLSLNIVVLALSLGLLIGCAGQNSSVTPSGNPSGTKLILPEAMKAKEISLEMVKSIELLDLEGALVDKQFSKKDIEGIVKAYNEAMIDDTAYIKMITGNRMVITFQDGSTIHIHSYGSDTHVVAGGKNMTYHLIAPEIANILLSK